MQRLTFVCLLIGALGTSGCDDDAAATPDAQTTDALPDARPDAALRPAIAFCEGPIAQRYDPFGSTEVEVFPDDLLTRPDPDSPTGLRLDLIQAAWLEQMPSLFSQTLADAATLSGFGHNGGVVLRFTGPLGVWPDDVEASTNDAGLMLIDLDADPPTRVPYSIHQSEGEATLIVRPARPLRAGARHGLVLTTAARDDNGECVAPSPTLRRLLAGDTDDPRMTALAPAYAALMQAAGIGPEQVSAATVFTTHREFEVLEAVVAGLADRPAEWAIPLTCEPAFDMRRCAGVVRTWDYRDDRAILTPAPTGTWLVPVTAYLPADVGPWPAMLMGHGLGYSRAESYQVARDWTRREADNVLVIGLDALGHGDHPTADPDDAEAVMAFLGLSLAELRVDGRSLTGNFEQTVLDRLHVLDLLRREPDLDGDGVDDVEPDRLGYFGISLGGLLGPAVMALDPSISAAVLQVPGGHLSQIATSSAPVEMFMPLIINLFGSQDRFERLLPLLQAVVDRADPATWAVRAMQRPTGAPHVLMQVSTWDEIVPPPTGVALARALGLPHVGQIIEPVPLLEPEATPTRGNLPGGVTGGFTQFDRTGQARIRPSSHTGLPGSAQARHQVEAFLSPWIIGETPVLVDAYEDLATPPLD